MGKVATWRAVCVAAVLTTIASILVTEVMVYFLFQGQDLRAALILAPLISFAITIPISFFIWAQVRRNVLLNEELQRLVDRDRLTNMATRDFFFSRMRDNPQTFGISLMVDIDHFKHVNDTYGHLAGDVVIAQVAKLLQANTRDDDIVCRFGGEEFIVFLKNHTKQSGFEVAERMRKMIAEQIVAFEHEQLRVTVSIGGSLKERLKDVELAIRQADAALYKAKARGRNQTVFAALSNGDQSAA